MFKFPSPNIKRPPPPNRNSKCFFELRGRVLSTCHVWGPKGLGSGFVVLYCNFRSSAFLGLLGFLIRPLKVQVFTTLLSAAK